jgi:peptidoglycan/LPS O-acetylase OafA/YrhL
MLQRIQSIWLLLAATMSALSLKFSFFSGNKLNAETNMKEWIEYTADQGSLNAIFTIAIGVAALVCIFMYKDRKRQLMISLIILAVSLLNIVLYYNASKTFTESKTDLTALISLSIPLFVVLAAIGIYKDEQLVKKADRLR